MFTAVENKRVTMSSLAQQGWKQVFPATTNEMSNSIGTVKRVLTHQFYMAATAFLILAI